MAIKKSNITSGSIDDLLDNILKVRKIGKTAFWQDYKTGGKVLMQTGDTHMEFALRTNPLLLTEERFLEVTNEFLSDKRMYIANATVSRSWLRKIFMGFTCYTLYGELYGE